MLEGDVKGSAKIENSTKTGDDKSENLTDVSSKNFLLRFGREYEFLSAETLIFVGTTSIFGRNLLF